MGLHVFLPELVKSMVGGVEPAVECCLLGSFSHLLYLSFSRTYTVQILPQILLLNRCRFVPVVSDRHSSVSTFCRLCHILDEVLHGLYLLGILFRYEISRIEDLEWWLL